MRVQDFLKANKNEKLLNFFGTPYEGKPEIG